VGTAAKPSIGPFSATAQATVKGITVRGAAGFWWEQR